MSVVVRPVIGLLTDFGLQDHYVASVKGVLLDALPDAQLVDITHLVPPQDVPRAAWILAASLSDLPHRTVVLAVVDPGVGTPRRGLAVSVDGRIVVAPDNGLLTHVIGRAVRWRAVSLTAPRFWRRGHGATFEGRDRFAPVAAHLAAGGALEDVGEVVHDLVFLPVPPVHEADGLLTGHIACIDHFGNLITTITTARVEQGGYHWGSCRGRQVPVVRTYAERAAGDVCLVPGSSGFLEVAVVNGSAQALLEARIGTTVRLGR
jgi:S-adenosyl-L-methionine hydrolase (adenosine-forming)